MTINLEMLPTAVFAAVILCWLVFAGIFLFRKKPPAAAEQKREKMAMFGIVLESVGYAAVWSIKRPLFTPLFPMPAWLEVIIAVLTVSLAIASVWLVLAAVRTLGKQWSVAARIVEGHKLVSEGPYRFVRNPIYTGMFGMMLATGLAISHWMVLLPAAIIFWAGTMLRVRCEEKLLRETFGKEFDEYASRVPSTLPRL